MLYDMQLRGVVKLSMLCYSKQKEKINAKSKKTEIYQEKQTLYVDLLIDPLYN
jgi:hypothetical protein